MDKLREDIQDKDSELYEWFADIRVINIEKFTERVTALLQAAREQGRKEVEKEIKLEVALTNGYWLKRIIEVVFGAKRFADKPVDLLKWIKYVENNLKNFDYTNRIGHRDGTKLKEHELFSIVKFMQRLPKSRTMPKYLKVLIGEFNLTKQKGE